MGAGKNCVFCGLITDIFLTNGTFDDRFTYNNTEDISPPLELGNGFSVLPAGYFFLFSPINKQQSIMYIQ